MEDNPAQSPDDSFDRPFRETLLAMLGIAFINILVALDQTVVSTALPSIVSDLKGFEFYAWIATIYLLASVVSTPIFGRLGDYFGRKPFVLASIITFTVGSVLCGMATNMPFLVFARAIQGIGGGMMVGTAYAAVPDLFPNPVARLRWQVMLASGYGIGTAAGPSIGGFLSEHYGWRSTFYLNVPPGLLALACIWFYLPARRSHHKGRVTIDWQGALWITVALASLQLVVEALPKEGLTRWTLSLMVAVVVATAAFVWTERRATHPIVPLDLFRDRLLVVIFWLSVAAGLILFSLIFYVPLLLQGGFQLSPAEAGLLATPLAACIAVGSLINTRIIVHLRRPARILTVGFVLLAGAGMIVSTCFSYTPHWFLEIGMVCAGVGLGFIFNNLNIFAQELAGPAHFGIITALLQSTRMVGGMLGTALVGMLVSRLYSSGASRVVEQMVGPATGARLAPLFRDPEILIDSVRRDGVLAQLRGTGLDGAQALNATRDVLVGAIHTSQILVVLAAISGVVLMRKIAHLQIHRDPSKAAHDAPPMH